jgi:hypothetical protein
MRTVVLNADWDPRPGFQLGSKDIEGTLTYLGSKVWRNPRIEIVDKDIPSPGPTEMKRGRKRSIKRPVKHFKREKRFVLRK